MYDEDYFIKTKQDLEDEEINQKEGLEAGVALMEQEGLNSIHFKPETRPSDKPSLTHYGGRPSVPEGFEWPYFEGTDWESVKKKRPLSFIAQFDCRDLQPFDREHVLPEKGILSFFYEFASTSFDERKVVITHPWCIGPKSYVGYDEAEEEELKTGRVRVFHFDSNSSFKVAEFPKDLDEQYRLPKKDLTLWPALDTPGPSHFYYLSTWPGYFAESLCEVISNAENGVRDPSDPRWESIHRELMFNPKDFPEPVDKAIAMFNDGPNGTHLLGYPHFFQEDEFEQYEPGSWRLLLQVDADDMGDSKLASATENGVLFFTIPTANLLRHDFAHIAGTVQFS